MNDQTAKEIAPHCIICHNQFDLYYRTPRVVPKCGHTFCEKCMTLRLTVKTNRRVFCCPDCGSEAVIRKSVADDVPKNMGIIDVVKSLKRYSYNEWQQQKRSSLLQTCPQHNRSLQLICQTCSYKKICSHCALFGEHRNHSFVKQMPASKMDLNELKSNFEIVSDSIAKCLLPHGQSNIRVTMKTSIIEGLKQHVSTCFKPYYALIEKKQQQLLHECQNVVINEGNIDKNIDELVRQYDKLKDKYELDFKLQSQYGLGLQKMKHITVQNIQKFIERCHDLHANLEKLMKHSSEHINKMLKDIGTHIIQTTIFKIQEFPFSIKKVIENMNGSQEMMSPNKRTRLKSTNSEAKTKSVIIVEREEPKNSNFYSFDRSNKSQNKTAVVPAPRKARETFSNIDKGEKKSEDFSTLEPAAHSELGQYKEQPQKELKQLISNKLKANDRSHLPPKAQKVKYSTAQTMNVRQPLKEETKTNDRKSVGKQRSPAHSTSGVSKQNQSSLLTEELKFVQPSKQISFQFLSKFQEIIGQIDRQSQSNTLQINSKDINDVLLLYILDYIRGKRYMFQVIKLVKNVITDEGMRNLLSYLIKDNTTQVINLTSNQLTAKTLDLILLFAQKNNILRTVYLRNNKISSYQLKSRASQLSKFQLEIIV